MTILWYFALVLSISSVWFPWLIPVAFAFAGIVFVVELHKPRAPTPWITEPVKPLSGIDAEIRRRYESNLLTTEQFVTAMESGKLPDSMRAYSGEARALLKEKRAARYDRELRRTDSLRRVQSKHYTWSTPRHDDIINHETYRRLK